MARVTVEDCLKNVKNRFELVILAAKRARQLMRGKEPNVEWDNDKPTVVALREIAAGFTDFDSHEQHEPVVHIEERIVIVQEEDDDEDGDIIIEASTEITVDEEETVEHSDDTDDESLDAEDTNQKSTDPVQPNEE